MPFVEINVKNELKSKDKIIQNLKRHGMNPVPSISS